ncbi:MAG TPA: hypothetical protein VGE14_07515, partial [Marmoricola sp.]
MVACIIALAPVVAACSSGRHETTSSASPFAAEAVAWRDARYAAGHACVANLSRFFDERVLVDDRVAGKVYQGRRAYLEGCGLFAASLGSGGADPAEPMALLLSADELLDQFSYPKYAAWSSAIDHWIVRGSVGPQGYTRLTTAASLEHWRTQVPRSRSFDRFERLADRYVAVWNGGEGVDATDVYADAASVEDSLTGQAVLGLPELRAAAASGQWPDLPRMVISELPDELPDELGGDSATISRTSGVRAIYVGPARSGTTDSDELVLVVQVDDGSGCPGVIGVAMAVDHGRITRERRYHEVESVRRCMDASTVEPGWWEGIEVPSAVVHELTSTVASAGPRGGLEIFNGTPEADTYVRWGLQRFADAGLELPVVDSVTFALDQSTCPLRRPGFARFDDSSAEISLCFQPERVCDDADCSSWTTTARQTLLHEYSHAWIAQNVPESAREAFMRLAGVSRWQDFDDGWGQRGVEQAANTMMSALMDEPWAADLGACAVFAARFRLLAGVDPLARCS